MTRAAGCERDPLGIMALQGVVPRSCSEPLSPEPEPVSAMPWRLSGEIEPDSPETSPTITGLERSVRRAVGMSRRDPAGDGFPRLDRSEGAAGYPAAAKRDDRPRPAAYRFSSSIIVEPRAAGLSDTTTP